jgi:acyl-CoA synthetase (AMP-forming)/AMP-acid ligase II
VNLAAIIESHPAASVALSHDGSQLTYGELRERAARVRTGLAGAGIVAGDHVALVFPTTPAFVVAYLGVLAARSRSSP